MAAWLLLAQRWRARVEAASRRAEWRHGEAVKRAAADGEAAPAAPAPVPLADLPVVFSHHVYSVVRHRSTVDLELHDACAGPSRRLRQLYTSAGPGCRAVVDEGEYRALARGLCAGADAEVVSRFIELVLPATGELSISSKQLRDLLHGHGRSAAAEELGGAGGGLARARAAAAAAAPLLHPELALCRAGLLIRRVDVFDANSYWFTVPRLGDCVHVLLEGRKHVLAAVKRRRNAEMLERDLRATVAEAGVDGAGAGAGVGARKGKSKAPAPRDALARLAGLGAADSAALSLQALARATSLMGIDYHIMDCVESGALRSTVTGLGPLLKLVEQR